MKAEMRSFLLGVGEADLKTRGVIRGQPQWLVQESIAPLIELMNDRGVSQLVFGWDWFLNVDGSYHNPDHPTNLFTEQNNPMNPFLST